MTYFIVYMEQVEYQEYDLVVEAESIKSIKDKWDEISDVVDDYCYNDDIDGLEDDNTITGTDIKVIHGTQECKGLWIDNEEVVSVVKVDEGEDDEI